MLTAESFTQHLALQLEIGQAMTSERLAAVLVSAQPLNGEVGRALVTARDHRAVVDAPLALSGPNQEQTPVELLAAAVASEALFVIEHAACQAGIPLQRVSARARVDANPLGLVGEPVDPSLRRLRLSLEVVGPSQAQADCLARCVRARGSVLATLAQAMPVQVDIVAISL